MNPFYFFYYFFIFLILWIASSVFSFVPNPVNLKYPSPLGPNPTPGVPTTFAFVNNLSKNSHDFVSSGNLSHTYGEFTPPYTVYPASSSPCFIILAFSL